MRIFKKFPEDKKCPICKTNENKECTLISIVGTNTEDNKFTYEAEIFHIDCLELWFDKERSLIYQSEVKPNE